MAPTRARTREEQGRLFWVWLLTLPILLLLAAAAAFDAPWPNPTTQRVAMVMLAFPVIFVVGEPLMVAASRAARGQHKNPLALLTATIVLGCYASGILALFAPLPALASVAAVVVSVYLTLRYWTGRY